MLGESIRSELWKDKLFECFVCYFAVVETTIVRWLSNHICGSLLRLPHYVEYGTPVLRRNESFATDPVILRDK